MKKTNINYFSVILVAAAVFMMNSARAAQVYDKDGTSLAIGGRLQAVYYGKDADEEGGPETGDANLNSSGRLNIGVRTALSDRIDGFAYAEWDVADGDGHGQFDARYSWIGVDFGQFGLIKGGRFEDAFYYVQEPSDIFDDFGGLGIFGNEDRRSGLIMYSWSGYGIDFNISYNTAKDDQVVEGAYFPSYDNEDATHSKTEKLDIEHGAFASLGYTSPDVLFGPISIRAGGGYIAFSNHVDHSTGYYYNQGFYYSSSDASVYEFTFRYDEFTQFGASLSWGTLDAGPYVAAMFQKRNFEFIGIPSSYYIADIDIIGADLVGGYTFANGLGLYLGVEYQEGDFGDIEVEALTVPVYIVYKFTPNFMVWAEGRFDMGTDDDTIKSFKRYTDIDVEQNIFSLGTRLTF